LQLLRYFDPGAIITSEPLIIPALDGYPLAATLRTPAGQPLGFIQVQSGTGIPQELYGPFADYLCAKGYVTLTFDYRGINHSSPKTLRGFEAHITDWGRLDMAGIFDWALNRYTTLKKIIIGHSMGGQMIGLMHNNNLIDQAIIIASCTGYWRDFKAPTLWYMPIWLLGMSMSTRLYGYARAKKLRQGEDLPKGVAMQFASWCTDPGYFQSYFESGAVPLYYDQLRAPLTSIQITDDPMANEVTANKLLAFYPNARKTVQRIAPEDLGVKKIGHTGYFSRRFRESLWAQLTEQL